MYISVYTITAMNSSGFMDSPQSDGDGEYDELVDAADSLDVGDLDEGRNPLLPGAPVTSR